MYNASKIQQNLITLNIYSTCNCLTWLTFTSKFLPVQMQWGLVKQSVILPDKFTANTLWAWGFHDHDFLSSDLKINNNY